MLRSCLRRIACATWRPALHMDCLWPGGSSAQTQSPSRPPRAQRSGRRRPPDPGPLPPIYLWRLPASPAAASAVASASAAAAAALARRSSRLRPSGARASQLVRHFALCLSRRPFRRSGPSAPPVLSLRRRTPLASFSAASSTFRRGPRPPPWRHLQRPHLQRPVRHAQRRRSPRGRRRPLLLGQRPRTRACGWLRRQVWPSERASRPCLAKGQ
mmetsp:Transcript_67924/g.196675  ORF Transcript_67924/g.196675 Transcript_67924/m.196675 type:complete len:214 (-) Transcript_67924:166-807(-)